jgi:hypothetical protein
MYIRVGTFYTNIIQILNFYLRKYIEFSKFLHFRKNFEEFIWKLLGIHFRKYFEQFIRKLLGTYFRKYFEEFIWKFSEIFWRIYQKSFGHTFSEIFWRIYWKTFGHTFSENFWAHIFGNILKNLSENFRKYFEEFIRKLLDIHFWKTFGHTFSEMFWRIYRKTFEQRFALPKTFLKFEFFQKPFYWPFYRIDIDISPLLKVLGGHCASFFTIYLVHIGEI